MRNGLIILLIVSSLMACATPTPYQPSGSGSAGFAQTALASDRYRISFRGNSRTDRETVELYVLHRAAEVTLESGADGFVITDRDTEIITTFVGTGFGHPRFFARSHRFRRHAGFFPHFGTGHAIPVRRYEAFAEIRTYQGQAKKGDDAYDARELIAMLGPQIVTPGEE